MPTLPERATSIVAVLGGFVPGAENATPTFDWRSIVREKKPGGASESQRQQAARLKRTLLDLRGWAEAQGLAQEHLEESAVYATVCTALDTPAGHVRALAMVIYWIYLVDDFLDRRDFAGAVAGGLGAAAWVLDADLATILHPLGARARALIWRCLARIGGREASAEAAALGHALGSLLGALQDEWATLPGGRRVARERMSLVTSELARCVAAMRTEVHWNLAFARQTDEADLPAFVSYARNGATSIGMPAVAAVAASFEEHPKQAWRPAHAVVMAGGGVVRLTNDVHTYFADADEGKVSAITIRLRELGLPVRGLDPDTSPEVRRAQAAVGVDLAGVIDRFARAQSMTVDGPLAYCVRHAVAFALAVYGDGSRHRQEVAA